MSGEKLTETQKVSKKRKAQASRDSEGGCIRQRQRRIERIRAMASYRLFKDSDNASKKIFGNFYFGEFFADVRCIFGHEVRLFNIGRGHFFACDKCRTYILAGSNLMQCWREENEDIWRKNSDSVKGYKFIE